MKPGHPLILSFALAAAILPTCAGAQSIRAPLDQEVMAGSVPVACTGIGQSKQDPKWASYPLRIEFSNPRREYLADVEVTVSSHGRTVASVSCEGAWVLMKVRAGPYGIQATLHENGRTGAASVRVPARGQARIVVVFPDN